MRTALICTSPLKLRWSLSWNGIRWGKEIKCWPFTATLNSPGSHKISNSNWAPLANGNDGCCRSSGPHPPFWQLVRTTTGCGETGQFHLGLKCNPIFGAYGNCPDCWRLMSNRPALCGVWPIIWINLPGTKPPGIGTADGVG